MLIEEIRTEIARTRGKMHDLESTSDQLEQELSPVIGIMTSALIVLHGIMETHTPKLNFEYCECGCKGYIAQYKKSVYAIFWDLHTSDEKPFRVYDGHGAMGSFIGKAADIDAAKRIAEYHLKKPVILWYK